MVVGSAVGVGTGEALAPGGDCVVSRVGTLALAVAAGGSISDAAVRSRMETHDSSGPVERARNSREMTAPGGRRASHGVTGADGTPCPAPARDPERFRCGAFP